MYIHFVKVLQNEKGIPILVTGSLVLFGQTVLDHQSTADDQSHTRGICQPLDRIQLRIRPIPVTLSVDKAAKPDYDLIS